MSLSGRGAGGRGSDSQIMAGLTQGRARPCGARLGSLVERLAWVRTVLACLGSLWSGYGEAWLWRGRERPGFLRERQVMAWHGWASSGLVVSRKVMAWPPRARGWLGMERSGSA